MLCDNIFKRFFFKNVLFQKFLANVNVNLYVHND